MSAGAQSKEEPDDGLDEIPAGWSSKEEDSERQEETSERGERGSGVDSESDDEGLYLSGEEDSPDSHDPRARVLSVLELEDLLVKVAPDLSSELCLSPLTT